FKQTGGVVTAGNFTVKGTYTWSGGSESGSGTTVVPAGQALNLTGNAILDGRHLSVAGTMTLVNGGLLQNGNGAVIDITSTGTLDLAGDNQLSFFGGDRPTINNAGTFKKSSGAANSFIDVDVNNSGNFRAQSGTAWFRGGFDQT